MISIFNRWRSHKLLGDQLHKDSKSWLSPTDPSKNYNIGREVHRDGTATWFFRGSVFAEWNAKGSLLWIYGKRVSTTLSSQRYPSLTSRSRFGKDHLAVGRCSPPCRLVIHFLNQFLNHTRNQKHVQGGISLDGLFLFRF